MSGETPVVEAASSRADAYFRAGEALRGDQDHLAAIDAYTEALLLDPGHRDSLFALGATLSHLGRWGDARRVYEQALRVQPADHAAWTELCACYARLGMTEEEIQQRGARLRKRVLAHKVTPRQSFVAPGATLRFDETAFRQGPRILGFVSFALVVYAYITVGLLTHFTIGLAAAAAAALTMAAIISQIYRRHRMLAFRAVLHGMLYGLGVTLLVGLGSIVIAIVIAIRELI
jgi:tetratricopeptide (TPR) repeat protein